jgi:hypothetical protein
MIAEWGSRDLATLAFARPPSNKKGGEKTTRENELGLMLPQTRDDLDAAMKKLEI